LRYILWETGSQNNPELRQAHDFFTRRPLADAQGVET
jgi:hypothetical protein